MQSKPKAGSTGSIIALLGVVALVVGLILMLVLPEIGIGAWGILGVGLILLIIAVVIDFGQISKAISGRYGRFGMGTGVMSIIFIGITILVNAISIGQYYRVDTSALEQFTLTPQTIKVLQNLDDPVKVTAFFTSEKDTYGINDYVYSLITVYANYARNMTFTVIDPDQHPDVAKEYGISEYQTIAFESGDRRRLVAPSQFINLDESGEDIASLQAEHAFTSAILEVTGTAQKHIYFLTGHGEGDITTKFSDAKDGLLNDLYKVDTLNLATDPSIPTDCAVLVIVAPQNDFSDEEIVLIEAYLLSGGAVFVLTDPSGIEDIDTIIGLWGVNTGKGTIIDPSSSLAPHQDTPVVPYSRNYFYLSQVYFPGAVAIVPTATDSSVIIVNPLVITTASAWMDKNFSADTDPVFDSATEKMGMLYIGALVAVPSLTSTDHYTRLAVIGDSDFASNDNYNNGNNGDLFLNTVSWLSEETSLISIHRNIQPFRRLVINQSQTDFIRFSSIGLIPGIMIIVAGVIWWRRR